MITKLILERSYNIELSDRQRMQLDGCILHDANDVLFGENYHHYSFNREVLAPLNREWLDDVEYLVVEEQRLNKYKFWFNVQHELMFVDVDIWQLVDGVELFVKVRLKPKEIVRFDYTYLMFVNTKGDEKYRFMSTEELALSYSVKGESLYNKYQDYDKFIDSRTLAKVATSNLPKEVYDSLVSHFKYLRNKKGLNIKFNKLGSRTFEFNLMTLLEYFDQNDNTDFKIYSSNLLSYYSN
jgi:hypothetical protein